MSYKMRYTRPRFSSSKLKRAPQSNKKFINPERFVRAAKSAEIKEYVPTHAFADFALHPVIQRNLAGMGFITPSPIQDQTIPVGLEGKDIVGIANTGTGKTAAFAVPVLNRLLSEPRSRALILAPTRELAEQIEDQCGQIARGSRLSCALLIGGAGIGKQLKELRANPSIVIGTPGRIKDHIQRRSLNLAGFNIVVLDEVDRMLDMGFINDIRQLLGQTSKERQSFYFSATLDNRVKSIIDSFSSEPVMISVKQGETSDNVEQNVVVFESVGDKINKLHDLLIHEATVKALVFDATHRSVERLNKELLARGFATDSIHGGRSQPQRQRALKKFKNNEINVLVATDVAARGLDVSDITHVINYSTPQTYEDYVHRIGRTGRAGKTGHALTFVAR